MKIYKYEIKHNGELNIIEDNSIRMFIQKCSMRGVVYDSKILIECNNFGIKLNQINFVNSLERDDDFEIEIRGIKLIDLVSNSPDYYNIVFYSFIKLSERDIDKLRKKVFELKDESI